MASSVTTYDTTWVTPRTWSTGELVTATLLNTHLRDQLAALKSPGYFQCEIDEAANYTTTSATFADVDATNLSATIVTGGGNILVGFSASIDASTTQVVNFVVDVDGTPYPGDDGIGGTSNDMIATGGLVSFSFIIRGLSAGSHTFKLQWKTSAGTATMYAGAGTTSFDNHPRFWGVDLV